MSNFKNVTVYVSNFDSKKMSEDLLTELFDQIERVQSVSLKGEYAFVNFKDEACVRHVCAEMDGIKVFGIPLNVKPKARSKIERIDDSRKRKRSNSRDLRHEESHTSQKRYKKEESIDFKDYDRGKYEKRAEYTVRDRYSNHRDSEKRGKYEKYEKYDREYKKVYISERNSEKYRDFDYSDEIKSRYREGYGEERRYREDERYGGREDVEFGRYSGRIKEEHRMTRREYTPERIKKRNDYHSEDEFHRNERYENERRPYIPIRKYESNIHYLKNDSRSKDERISYRKRGDNNDINEDMLNLKENLYKALIQYDRINNLDKNYESNNKYIKEYHRNDNDKYSNKPFSRNYDKRESNVVNRRSSVDKNTFFISPKFNDTKIKKTIYNDNYQNNENVKRSLSPEIKNSNRNVKKEEYIEINTKDVPQRKSKCIKVNSMDDLEEGEMTS